MKAKGLVYALGILALSLVGTIAYIQRQAAPAGHGVVASSEAPGTESSAAPSQTNAPVSAVAAKKDAFSWRQIESTDYHKYIEGLRSIGCPEQTIRDIIVADVNKLYADRENPLKSPPKGTPENPITETPEQKLARLQQLRTLQQEKRWVVKELLGIDLPLDMLPSSGSRDYHAFEVALSFLPQDKRDSVQALQEAYWQQSDALKAKYGKKKTAEFVSEYRQLGTSLRQELGKILTPGELEDYDMRTSAEAKQLSDKLATYFRPSEDEFRRLFKSKREYEETIEQLNLSSSDTPLPADPAERKAVQQQRAAERQALNQARSQAQEKMTSEIKTALGDDRYNEYLRSQDHNYDLLARLGIRYGLPQETVQQAYELQKSFKPAPQPDGVKVDTAALQQQLNDQLAALLGEQASRAYRRVKGGTVPLN